jgi:hypothetical protein
MQNIAAGMNAHRRFSQRDPAGCKPEVHGAAETLRVSPEKANVSPVRASQGAMLSSLLAGQKTVLGQQMPLLG